MQKEERRDIVKIYNKKEEEMRQCLNGREYWLMECQAQLNLTFFKCSEQMITDLILISQNRSTRELIIKYYNNFIKTVPNYEMTKLLISLLLNMKKQHIPNIFKIEFIVPFLYVIVYQYRQYQIAKKLNAKLLIFPSNQWILNLEQEDQRQITVLKQEKAINKTQIKMEKKEEEISKQENNDKLAFLKKSDVQIDQISFHQIENEQIKNEEFLDQINRIISVENAFNEQNMEKILKLLRFQNIKLDGQTQGNKFCLILETLTDKLQEIIERQYYINDVVNTLLKLGQQYQNQNILHPIANFICNFVSLKSIVQSLKSYISQNSQSSLSNSIRQKLKRFPGILKQIFNPC